MSAAARAAAAQHLDRTQLCHAPKDASPYARSGTGSAAGPAAFRDFPPSRGVTSPPGSLTWVSVRGG
ncbi:hypothetical protein GCM10023237_53710 [Streptomyces coeruleoprunus]